MAKTWFHRFLLLFVSLAFGVSLAQDAWAQGVTTGAIRGSVVDQNGQPLAGAQVLVIDTRTGTRSGGLTGEDGRFFISYLQPGGPYTVSVQSIGYRAQEQLNVRVSLSRTENLRFRLEQTAVEVEPLSVSIETNPLFSSSKTGTSTDVSREVIENFPTRQRQITDFAILDPYVNVVEASPSIAGQNNRFNNIQIDGAVNNDVFGLADSGVPGGQASAKPISIEAIEELNVLTSPFDVKFSGFTGGLINAVTKAGTNQWSGSAFGYFTSESFVSDLCRGVCPPDEKEAFGEFNDTQFGWTLGGPIVKDKLHLFTSGEFQINNAPGDGSFVVPGAGVDANAIEAGVHPDSVARFAQILRDLGFEDVGEVGQLTFDNPRTNLFARLDWSINDQNRAVFRWNHSHARDEASPDRFGSDYGLGSHGFDFNSNTHSFVGQLFSSFGGRWDNEFLANLSFIRDKRDPLVDWAQIEVDNTSDLGAAGSSTVDLLAGAERFSQDNQLDQDVFQLTNNLVGQFGDHRVLFGTSNEYFNFSNTFFEGSIGLYNFRSLADLENGIPSRYQVRSTAAVDQPATEFATLKLGFYVQDEWALSDQLTITGGLRADIPIMLDNPPSNPEFESVFGFSTSEVPSGNILWQPRLGFNWNSGAERMTQVRGGLGIFSGRSPFVWISNAYGNTGLESNFLSCSPDDGIPALNPANYPDNIPTACTGGKTGAGSVSFINVADPDFKFPTDLRASLGVDHELPGDFTITLEGMYTKAINQVAYKELNLVGQQGTDASQGGRPVFGTPSGDGFTPVRITEDFPQVVQITNSSENRAWILSAQVNRQLSDWLAFVGSYTWSDVEDTQGLFSSQATSNFGRNAISGDPNDPPRTTSSFERKHKIVISTTGYWQFGDSGFDIAVTPQYFGTSGAPFTYVISGDANGDFYPGGAVSSSRSNDIVYIPNNAATELNFRNAGDAEAYEALIDELPCMSEQRGQLMVRNSCTSPFRNLFDLRVVLGLPGGWSRGKAELVADFFNVFATKVVTADETDRGIRVLRLRGRVDGDPNNPLLFDYTGPRRDSETGEIDPYQTLNTSSRFRFQVGLRYRF